MNSLTHPEPDDVQPLPQEIDCCDLVSCLGFLAFYCTHHPLSEYSLGMGP